MWRVLADADDSVPYLVALLRRRSLEKIVSLFCMYRPEGFCPIHLKTWAHDILSLWQIGSGVPREKWLGSHLDWHCEVKRQEAICTASAVASIEIPGPELWPWLVQISGRNVGEDKDGRMLRLVLPRSMSELVGWGLKMNNCLGDFTFVKDYWNSSETVVALGAEGDVELRYLLHINHKGAILESCGMNNQPLPDNLSDKCCNLFGYR